MRLITYILILIPLLSSAQWIESPLRSDSTDLGIKLKVTVEDLFYSSDTFAINVEGYKVGWLWYEAYTNQNIRYFIEDDLMCYSWNPYFRQGLSEVYTAARHKWYYRVGFLILGVGIGALVL